MYQARARAPSRAEVRLWARSRIAKPAMARRMAMTAARVGERSPRGMGRLAVRGMRASNRCSCTSFKALLPMASSRIPSSVVTKPESAPRWKATYPAAAVKVEAQEIRSLVSSKMVARGLGLERGRAAALKGFSLGVALD